MLRVKLKLFLSDLPNLSKIDLMNCLLCCDMARKCLNPICRDLRVLHLRYRGSFRDDPGEGSNAPRRDGVMLLSSCRKLLHLRLSRFRKASFKLVAERFPPQERMRPSSIFECCLTYRNCSALKSLSISQIQIFGPLQ